MIFKGQTITLSLDTGRDLTGWEGFILYKKSNGIHGEWLATITGDTVSYDIAEGDIDIAGVWHVQAKATLGTEREYGKLTVVEFRTHL